VENAGVIPDVEIEPALVEPSPEPDPQLARAVAAILQQQPRRP
jgi:C-terminal processing protease CtpA/Prc